MQCLGGYVSNDPGAYLSSSTWLPCLHWVEVFHRRILSGPHQGVKANHRGGSSKRVSGSLSQGLQIRCDGPS